MHPASCVRALKAFVFRTSNVALRFWADHLRNCVKDTLCQMLRWLIFHCYTQYLQFYIYANEIVCYDSVFAPARWSRIQIYREKHSRKILTHFDLFNASYIFHLLTIQKYSINVIDILLLKMRNYLSVEDELLSVHLNGRCTWTKKDNAFLRNRYEANWFSSQHFAKRGRI